MDAKNRDKRYKCDECSLNFMYKSQIKKHKNDVHSELRPFQCDRSDYRAKLKWSLTQHYATHFPQTHKTQSCPHCPYKCVRRQDLLVHLRVHTKEKPFACNMCSYRASTHFSLTLHSRSHTGEKPFKCSLCMLTFSQSGNLKKHKLFVHNKDKVQLVACSIPGCDRRFTNKYEVRRHVECFHNKETRFSCPYCQKAFYRKASCISHIQNHSTKERPFNCNICEYAAATYNQVKIHENTSHGEYMAVECRVCHRKYKNNQSLARHHSYAHNNLERRKEQAPQWKCKEPGCTKEYKFRQSLRKHFKSFHLKQRPFKCLFCEHTTATADQLNTPLKRHTREKLYCCDLCKRSFITRSELSIHKTTAHSELRPFQCDQCSYSAKTKQNLNQHKKIHESNSKQTTFECHICKESRGSKKQTNCSFGTKIHLNYHMKITHFNQGSLKCSPPPPGAKAKNVTIPKMEPTSTIGLQTTRDCPPCFVRLVRKTELKMDSHCKTTITIYA